MEQDTLIRNIKFEIDKSQDDLAGYFRNLKQQFVHIAEEGRDLTRKFSALDAPHEFREMLKVTYKLSEAKSLKNTDLQSSMTAYQIENLRAKEMITLIDNISDYAQRYMDQSSMEMLSGLLISKEIISNSSSAINSTLGRIQKFQNRMEGVSKSYSF